MLPELIVPPPRIEDRVFQKPLLCGPGPCDVWPSVLEALSRPVITPICDEYFNVVDDIRNGLKYMFQTKCKLVMGITGSGHAGMETVISNLLAPKDTILIASTGIWGDRAAIMAKRYGLNVVSLQIPINTTFSLEYLEPHLKKLRPTALFVTHGDGSTGTIQRIEGLGALCHKYDVLLLADTVVSLGGEPFFMDAWEVDATYTSTQKAFSGPAGISAVAFSDLAEAKILNRIHEPPYYFDAKILAQQWNCYGDTRHYHHTMAPPLLWALRCCLQETCGETLPVAWKRHRDVLLHFHKKLEKYGFQFLVTNPEERLVTATTIVLPEGYDYGEFTSYMRTKHNILIFKGLGPTVGKALRIGIMGVNATIKVADSVADAMADTLRALTKS